MDYKAFLKKPASEVETLVLPYFGGTKVDTKDRRFSVEGELAPGWWRFQIDGRRAVSPETAHAADLPELSVLPAVRGHFFNGWVVVDGKQMGRIPLTPDDEPAPLSRVTARRWYSNDLLFDTTEFEDDAELAARTALEERRPLGDVKGVVPSLRAAFGYALGMALFTVIMGNAFAAFPVMAAAIGIPLLIETYGGNAAVIGAVGMLAGFCGTLLTPMAANFNIVPAALLELDDQNAVIRQQVGTALPLWACNVAILYVAGCLLWS